MADEVRLEHKYLQKLMNRQGFPGISAPALWVGERVARVKSYFPKELKNAPSVLVLETELMLSAVTGKLHGWKTLLNNTAALGVPASVLNSLSRIPNASTKTPEAHQYAGRGRSKSMSPRTIRWTGLTASVCYLGAIAPRA